MRIFFFLASAQIQSFWSNPANSSVASNGNRNCSDRRRFSPSSLSSGWTDLFPVHPRPPAVFSVLDPVRCSRHVHQSGEETETLRSPSASGGISHHSLWRERPVSPSPLLTDPSAQIVVLSWKNRRNAASPAEGRQFMRGLSTPVGVKVPISLSAEMVGR